MGLKNPELSLQLKGGIHDGVFAVLHDHLVFFQDGGFLTDELGQPFFDLLLKVIQLASELDGLGNLDTILEDLGKQLLVYDLLLRLSHVDQFEDRFRINLGHVQESLNPVLLGELLPLELQQVVTLKIFAARGFIQLTLLVTEVILVDCSLNGTSCLQPDCHLFSLQQLLGLLALLDEPLVGFRLCRGEVDDHELHTSIIVVVVGKEFPLKSFICLFELPVHLAQSLGRTHIGGV